MNNDLFTKIMILFLIGLLVGLAISSSKECPEHFNREDVFLITYNSPILIKEQTYATITAYNTVPEQTWETLVSLLQVIISAERKMW